MCMTEIKNRDSLTNSQATEVFLVGHWVLLQNVDIFKGVCKILIIFNKCLNVRVVHLSIS
jgi:hypothetical protein